MKWFGGRRVLDMRKIILISPTQPISKEEGDPVGSRVLGSPCTERLQNKELSLRWKNYGKKWGLKTADFSPSWVIRGCASRGLRGLRPEQCPPALQLRCPGTAGVTPPRATRDTGSRRGRESGFSPHAYWKRRMFFPVKLLY